jgi:hypothetical protein
MKVQFRELNDRFRVRCRRLNVRPTVLANDASWPMPPTEAESQGFEPKQQALPAFEKLLALHDSQLTVAPLHKVIDAERKLARFLQGTASSPVPRAD